VLPGHAVSARDDRRLQPATAVLQPPSRLLLNRLRLRMVWGWWWSLNEIGARER
jgi:hypothetical protein